MLDEKIDDGGFSKNPPENTGDFVAGPSGILGNDYHWVVVWDYK